MMGPSRSRLRLISVDKASEYFFWNYINENSRSTLNYGEPRLADGTIARIRLYENTYLGG